MDGKKLAIWGTGAILFLLAIGAYYNDMAWALRSAGITIAAWVAGYALFTWREKKPDHQ